VGSQPGDDCAAALQRQEIASRSCPYSEIAAIGWKIPSKQPLSVLQRMSLFMALPGRLRDKSGGPNTPQLRPLFVARETGEL
jgi:hypothetical protein